MEREKTCACCGRRIEWRKKWERCWEQVKYCSDACRARARTRGAEASGDALETAILELLAARAAGATICPSEAARKVHPDDWRERMEDARSAARRLVARGRVQIVQGGRPVDPSHARGPIRLRAT